MDFIQESLEERVARLEAENQALREFIKHSPKADAVFDNEMRYLAASDVFLNGYGIADKPYLGKTHYELFPEVPQRWKDIHSNVLEDNIQRNDADGFQREDGSWTYTMWECRPWYEADGSVGGLIMYTEVITEKLEAQKEANMFKKIVENMLDGISVVSSDGTFEYINPAYVKMFGYDHQELLAINSNDTLVESPERLQKLGEEMMTEGKWEGKLGFRRKDGSHFEARVASRISKGDDDQPIGFISSLRDMTEQNKMAKALQDSEQKYQFILNKLPGITVALVDSDYRYEFFGGGEISNMGVDPAYVEGKTILEVFGEEYHEMWKVAVDTALQGEVYKVETYVGDQTYDSVTIPVEDATGEINRILNIGINITERKVAEKERVRLQQEIIEAQQQALKDLSTPIIPLMDGVLVMPLVGSIDTQRSRDIMRGLLAGISEHRAKTVIVDITGVPVVDTGVADHLNKTIQAARLKGAHTIVTGISDAVAETIVDLGIDWSEVETLRDLQSGLQLALKRIGIEISAQ